MRWQYNPGGHRQPPPPPTTFDYEGVLWDKSAKHGLVRHDQGEGYQQPLTVSQSGQVEMKIKYLHPTAFWLFLEGNPNPFAVL